MKWKRTQFCRGWLITGDTGSGKTSSGINQLVHQVFQNEPTWGGLCIDEKGVYWETLVAMAQHYGREGDLIHLQIRVDDTDTQWTPPHSEIEEHKIKPHKLSNLRDHECVIVHCERGFRRATLSLLEAVGSISKWFSQRRRLV